MKRAAFNIQQLGDYQENNQLEVKRAKGGLPHSVWETYSAFANTEGGLILLGVRENKGALYVEGVEQADHVIRDFWNTINNTQKVNVNILTDSMVFPQQVDGKTIIIIDVPRADREMRPIYVGTDPYKGSYRRNHEGDYHCTKEQVTAMFRDASPISLDMKVLAHTDFSVFDKDTIRAYRNRFRAFHENHIWLALDDEIFMRRIGAMGLSSEDNKIHPTVAGLLMFGYDFEITREFPDYFLDYQECFDPSMRWTHRIVSNSGDWSGNLFDFFFRVYPRLIQNLSVPFSLDGVRRISETQLHTALREALLNAVVHADYAGRQGLVIVQNLHGFIFSNPGDMRISLKTALEGGVSDPRNSILMKMFSLIGVGERAGSGIPDLVNVWHTIATQQPTYTILANPTRTHLTIPIEIERTIADNSADKLPINDKIADNSADKLPINDKIADNLQQIVEYVRKSNTITRVEVMSMFHISERQARNYLQALVKKNILQPQGANKNRSYTLKG